MQRQQNSQSSQHLQTAGSCEGSVLDDLNPTDLETSISAQPQPLSIQSSALKADVHPPPDSRLQSAVPGPPGILPDNADPSQLQSYPPVVHNIIE